MHVKCITDYSNTNNNTSEIFMNGDEPGYTFIYSILRLVRWRW